MIKRKPKKLEVFRYAKKQRAQRTQRVVLSALLIAAAVFGMPGVPATFFVRPPYASNNDEG